MIEDGGKSDFHYGKDWQIMGQPPVKVDRVLRSGDTVRLGELILTGYNTPDHTRGATTWITTLLESGKAYNVVFQDGSGFNPGYQIAKCKNTQASIRTIATHFIFWRAYILIPGLPTIQNIST